MILNAVHNFGELGDGFVHVASVKGDRDDRIPCIQSGFDLCRVSAPHGCAHASWHRRRDDSGLFKAFATQALPDIGIDVELVAVEIDVVLNEFEVMRLEIIHCDGVVLADDVHHAVDAERAFLRSFLIGQVEFHLGVRDAFCDVPPPCA